MKQTHIKIFSVITLLVLVSLACSFFGGKSEEIEALIEEAEEVIEESDLSDLTDQEDGDTASGESDFPYPDGAKIMMEAEDLLIYQIPMEMDEVIKYYRQEFGRQGMTERELLTVIEDSTFSLVFDGAPNGLSIVVQGVDFGGEINVSIRYEET